MESFRKDFLIGFFCWKGYILNFHFPHSFSIFCFYKIPPHCSKVRRYPKKQVPKSMTFFSGKDERKSLLINFLMRFSESSSRKTLIYRFSANSGNTGGRYVLSKLEVSQKVKLEINQVKVRILLAQNQVFEIQIAVSLRRKQFGT